MFPKKNTYVDSEIARAIFEMKDLEVDSAEYGAILDRLGKLHKIRQEEKPDKVSTDTIIQVAANLIGILMIIHHEELHPLTTKALSFIRLGR